MLGSQLTKGKFFHVSRAMQITPSHLSQIRYAPHNLKQRMFSQLILGNSKMSSAIIGQLKSNDNIRIIPNRSTPSEILKQLNSFQQQHHSGIVIDAAYNPHHPREGHILTDRFKFYSQANIRHVVVITRVNDQQIDPLNTLCKTFGIKAIHMPNMVVGMALLNYWLTNNVLKDIQTISIHNAFHHEKPGGASEGAKLLETQIKQRFPNLAVTHTWSRENVPYKNHHSVTLTNNEGSLSICIAIDRRESSMASIHWMQDTVKTLHPGFHINHQGLAVFSDTQKKITSSSLYLAKESFTQLLRDNGYVKRPDPHTDSISFIHPNYQEVVTLTYTNKQVSPIFFPTPPSVTVVGSGPMGTFTAFALSHHLKLPVNWVLGQHRPAAESSSLNLHLDIIFNRKLNGEMYNIKTLGKDLLAEQSGVVLGDINFDLIRNGLTSFYLSKKEDPHALPFTQLAGSMVRTFWETPSPLQPFVKKMTRPQLVTKDSEVAMKGLYTLLQSRGSAVRWEENRSFLSQLIGQEVGPRVIGAILHEGQVNGEVDFSGLRHQTQQIVEKNGGRLLPFDADFSVSRHSSNRSELVLSNGSPIHANAEVLATGSWRAGTTPLTGVSATFYSNFGLQCPVTIGRFTFSSMWNSYARFTSGIGINTNRSEIPLKLVHTLIRDIQDGLPFIAEQSGLTAALTFNSHTIQSGRVRNGSFIYHLQASGSHLFKMSIFDLNDHLLADISPCPGRPFRAENIPLHKWDPSRVTSPDTHMAGLNWGPFSGYFNARLIQKILGRQGIETPELPFVQPVEGFYPILEKEKGQWPVTK